MNAALKPAVDTTRYNIYTIIHKALRAFMTDTLLKVGKMDVTDDSERDAAIEQVRGLLVMCGNHLRHENEHIHTALEKARQHASARTAEDHRHHEAAIAKLFKELALFEAASADRRAALAQRLYLNLSNFVAENFEHMLAEEVENHAELIAAYTEEEVFGIERAIVASLDPKEAYDDQYWMLPFINSSERAFVIGGIKQHAPPEVFNAVLGLARDRLSQRDFYKLERALA